MTTEIRTDAPAEELDELQTVFAYKAWQQGEGIPIVTGYYVEDMATLDVEPWARKGALGCFVNLEGTGGVNDLQIVEIPAGRSTDRDRHMFETLIYVVSGTGSTSVWYDESDKQTFEWGPGSLFAVPLNAKYQFHNGSGLRPARLALVTNAPTIMNIFHSEDFVYNNPFIFTDRFAGEAGFFNGEGKLWRRARNRVWETNFVPDVRTVQLHS